MLAILATSAIARTAPAHAEPEVVAPAIVLDAGDVRARLSIEASLARDAVLAPLSIAPDVWVGVTDRLTLGATSSDAARDWIGAGRGACLRDQAHGCDAVFGGAAADARFRLRDGAVTIAGRGALDFRGFGPGVVALEIGVIARSRAGALIFTASPYLALGIVNPSLDNHVRAVVPVELAWPLGARVAIEARTGVRGDLDDFAGTAQVPFALGATLDVAAGVSLGASAGLPRALGAGAGGGLDERVAELHVAWRN